MAAFPVEPKFAKTILRSPKFQGPEEILTIVSLLSMDNVLCNPPAWRDEVPGVGNHIILLNIYWAFKNIGGNKYWCKENFVNGKNMMPVYEVRAQLREICLKMSMPIMSLRGDRESIHLFLAHSLFMSTTELQPDGTYAIMDTQQPMDIHPLSVFFHRKPVCVVYTELLYTNKCYLWDICMVDTEWLYEAAPEYFLRKLRTARI
ncbi:Putative ATP-dependent RNA helicase DHX33 [Fukomys damarensis]|uniref:RNA helicase n=1 Tax=Fukomys damarensis TaxID=885580 RepID=A0A091D6A4_FUKDA|nr:Putative ATP-dependent RNA helicase DHX33 [Fukomys damarensis]